MVLIIQNLSQGLSTKKMADPSFEDKIHKIDKKKIPDVTNLVKKNRF